MESHRLEAPPEDASATRAGVCGADSDLLYGMPAIARHLNIRPRQAHHLKEKGGLPIFDLAGVLCARRSTLNAWIADRERTARAAGPVKVKNSGPRGRRAA